MTGFTVVGSFPVAAVPAGNAGIIYTPGTVTVIFQGFAPTLNGIVSPIRVQQAAREALFTKNNAKVALQSAAREALFTKDNARVAVQQITREVLRAQAELAEARISSVSREALININNAKITIQQVIRETLHATAPPAPDYDPLRIIKSTYIAILSNETFAPPAAGGYYIVKRRNHNGYI